MPWSFSTGTKYLDCYPTADKGATEARLSLQGYIGPRQTVSSFQCDGAKELYKAAIELGLCPSTSRPYVSQSNSVAERQIRHVEEGTRTLLEQCGFAPAWWPYAARCVCLAATTREYDSGPAWVNATNKNRPLGLRVPFGSLIHFLPPTPYLQGQPKFSSRAIPGLFLGYHLHPGAIFKGEYYVVSLEEYKCVAYSRERLAPIVHRVKEATVPAGSCRFPARHDRERLVRDIPVTDSETGGGNAPPWNISNPKTTAQPVNTCYSYQPTYLHLP